MSSLASHADSNTLDSALEKYYAGYPQAAIEMIQPVANAGDAKAQTLLGNILYSLSTSRGGESLEESIDWYRMAAAQGAVEANYALAVIYENSWAKSGREEEVANAMVYYGEAADLGADQAPMRLRRLEQRSGLTRDDALGLYRLNQVKAPTTDEVESVKIQAVESADIVETVEDSVPAVPEPAETDQPIAIVEAPVEADPVEPEVIETEQVAVSQVEEDPVGPPVTLAELFHQCQNLTEAGFVIFADSIEESRFSGTARMIDVKAEAFDSNNYRARLASTESGNTLFITLDGVPKEVADTFQRGTKYQINGIIQGSELSGSRCNLGLQYPSANG